MSRKPKGIYRVKIDVLVMADGHEASLRSIKLPSRSAVQGWEWSVVRDTDGKLSPGWRIENEKKDGSFTIVNKRREREEKRRLGASIPTGETA